MSIPKFKLESALSAKRLPGLCCAQMKYLRLQAFAAGDGEPCQS